MRTLLIGRMVMGVFLVAALAALARTLMRAQAPAVRARLSLEETLGGADTAGFARATEPLAFTFPADHGEHPEFRNEWWYFTGNLETADGRRFGYQFTLFRGALAPAMPPRTSGWASRQAYMAHLALTDVATGRFVAFERFARGAQGLAGATPEPFRVWLEDWSVERDANAASSPYPPGDARSIFPLRIKARQGDVSIELLLRAGKPIVLNGDAGLSRKGEEPGNASYYYSFTRLPTVGTVTTGAGEARVNGASWLDREWSTSALAEGVSGWDWFALQLGDSTELMVYRLRRADGTTDPYSAGTWVDRSGVAKSLGADDFSIERLDEWASPLDGSRYPARWQIRVPLVGVDLEVIPAVADQELDLSLRYWEGAVDLRGTSGGKALTGRGYVELTGYGGRAPGTRGARR